MLTWPSRPRKTARQSASKKTQKIKLFDLIQIKLWREANVIFVAYGLVEVHELTRPNEF